MTRQVCLGLCACLGLALSGVACGSGGSGAAKPWDHGRIANTGTDWWVNASKGAFFFSIKMTNSYQTDTAGRATAISFTEDVIGKLTPSTTAAASLLPTSGEVAGWTYDATNDYTATGPVTANNFDEATNYVDGAADPIFDKTRSYMPVALAWEVYTDGATHQMDAKVVQMASSANAGQLYNDVLNTPQYSTDNIPWSECTGSDPNPCGTP